MLFWSNWLQPVHIKLVIKNRNRFTSGSQSKQLQNTHLNYEMSLPRFHRAQIQQTYLTHLCLQRTLVSKCVFSVKSSRIGRNPYLKYPDYHLNTSLKPVKTRQRYHNLNGSVSIVIFFLNSLIVGLMEEEIRFLVLFNTAVPLAPALVAGQWAVWLEAGWCMVTRRREQWALCLSQHYLPA